MILIPIGTESRIPRTPLVNYVLIGLNFAFFVLFNQKLLGPETAGWANYFVLELHQPKVYQFLSYQFQHGDVWHLVGNMLFLYVFGNSVNAKMGNVAYLLFYLACGVFAGWGFGIMTDDPGDLIGASGAIAGVTTAYLALFPRDTVNVLFWLFIFVRVIQVQAMVVIGFKIILWDNIIAPNIAPHGAQADNVAYGAHLAGYLFGFVGGLGMLAINAVPRDHYDCLALLKQWRRRQEMRSAMRRPNVAGWGQYGTVAVDPAQRGQDDRIREQRYNEGQELRSKVRERFDASDPAGTVAAFDRLIAFDPEQYLSEQDQLRIGRLLLAAGRAETAARVFERFIDRYPYSNELPDVQFLLGIVYARDLADYDSALNVLRKASTRLVDPQRRAQCLQWIEDVEAHAGGSTA